MSGSTGAPSRQPVTGAAAAAVGRRAGAYVIDAAIALVILLAAAGASAGVSVATGGGFPLPVAGVVAYAVALGWFVVYTLMQGGAGSIGMRALGLRLAPAASAAPGTASAPAARSSARVGFGRALLRNVIWGLGAAIVVGYFSPLFDRSPWHRGWHDRVSGVVVTDVAGRGVAVEAPTSSASAATDAAASTPSAPAVPSVLPAAPILPVDEDTALAGWTPASAARPPAAAAASSGVISFVPGISAPERADPHAAPEPPRQVTPTVLAPAPAAAPQRAPEPVRPSAPVADDAPLARLVWDDGTRHAVYGRSVFGRNPAPEAGAQVFPVRDETLSLSKTHFEIVPSDDRALWVIDRHSTNGVVLRRGAARQAAAPGERLRVRGGDVLEFGDRSLRIEGAP